MESPLLETKLYIPTPRSGMVPRPALIARLERGASSKLTLVSAPAGFGKSTLLAEWLAAASVQPRPVAWLALDPSDDDSVSFWTYVIGALRTVCPDVGTSALSLLRSPQPPAIETLLVPLLNELGAEVHDIVLVLDDYHVIEARDIQDGMSFLLDHLAPQMHIVIASRADPPLPLARLRARGELLELRAADLRFTSEEAVSFLNGVMGLDLSIADIDALEARTEGWIAGLQLAALSMQGRDDVAGFIASFTGDDRYIVDYLVEEVLQRQPERLRTFLLQTSILERLSGPLCDSVTGRHDGKATLEALERANLFVVPLDDRRLWYRYHHLFADVLRAHLTGEQLAEVPALHRGASEWYEQHGELGDAIRHALVGGDGVRAAGLVELAAPATLRSYRSSAVLDWVNALPDDLVRARPVLSAYYAFPLLEVGELVAARARLDDAERWLAADGEAAARMVVADQAELASLPGIIALAHAFDAQIGGDVAATRTQARRALDLLSEDDDVWRSGAAILLSLAHWRSGELEAAQPIHDTGIASLERTGDISLAISAAYDGADLRKARGRLSEAMRIYERSLRVAAAHDAAALPGVADLHLGLSDLHRERNDREAAAAHLERSKELRKFAALPETAARECVAEARLQQLEGDLDRAIELLEDAERLHVPGPVPEIRPIGALKARLLVDRGRLPEARDWARAHALAITDDLDYAREYEHITLARILIGSCEDEGDQQAANDALDLLNRLLAEAEAHERTGSVIDILVLQALAHRARGETAAGLEALGRALTLAAPEGFVRTFVDEGEPMRDLLRRSVGTGAVDAYVEQLLSAFESPPQPDSASEASTGARLAEPLTAREVEIMRLVAAGMRNQEIADHLVISVPTVKRHVANVYGKLGVGHRTEAVVRANELGLL